MTAIWSTAPAVSCRSTVEPRCRRRVSPVSPRCSINTWFRKAPARDVGNMNPNLYALAQTNPDIFHDVTGGNNIVTANCPRNRQTCGNMPVGFNAGAGYDQATGLGSVDVSKLVTGWSGGGSVIPTAPATMSLLSNISSLGFQRHAVSDLDRNQSQRHHAQRTASLSTTTEPRWDRRHCLDRPDPRARRWS